MFQRVLWRRPYSWLVLTSILAMLRMSQPVQAMLLPVKQPAAVYAGMPSRAPNRAWQTEEVDAAGYSLTMLGRRYIAIDSDNVVHVVYGGGHLIHAWYQGGVWQAEVVDSARGVGAYASIALDSQDGIHLAYYDRVNQDLRYAKRMGGNPWSIQNVDTPGDVGKYAALTLDGNNRAHIAYLDATNGVLKYSVDYGGQFLDEDIDYGVSQVGDLALDMDGHPHIVFLDMSSGLKYATNSGSGWDVDVLTGAVGGLPSMALDSYGHAYIAYPVIYPDGYSLSGEIMVAYYDGAAFTNVSSIILGELPSNYDQDMNVTLVLDTSGNRYLSFYAASFDCLGYKENPVWEDLPSCVAYGAGRGYNASLALNSAGYPKIAYTYIVDESPYIYQLDYASYYCNLSNCQWGMMTIEQRGDVGRLNSLALDSANRPQISYAMHRLNQAWYASRTGGAWDLTLVDGSSNIITNLPLALDAQDRPHISYYDANIDTLQLAYNLGGGWTTEGLLAGITASGLSIAIDPQGYPHISYIQTGASDVLQHMWRTASGWNVEPVDTQVLLDLATSIALDSDNHAHILYDDYHNIQYAYYDGAQWHLEDIEPFHVAVLGSIALDAADMPHVSYCIGLDDLDTACTKVHYAYRDAGGWHTQTVDSGGVFGASSLALYDSGAPAISYYDAANGDLRYAYRICLVTCFWTSEIVDSYGDVGEVSSLQIAPNGSIHISYHDDSSDGLRYASYTPPPRQVFLPLTVK